jgi:hypothetical protein
LNDSFSNKFTSLVSKTLQVFPNKEVLKFENERTGMGKG